MVVRVADSVGVMAVEMVVEMVEVLEVVSLV